MTFLSLSDFIKEETFVLWLPNFSSIGVERGMCEEKKKIFGCAQNWVTLLNHSHLSFHSFKHACSHLKTVSN